MGDTLLNHHGRRMEEVAAPNRGRQRLKGRGGTLTAPSTRFIRALAPQAKLGQKQAASRPARSAASNPPVAGRSWAATSAGRLRVSPARPPKPI
jgi:hypothetical protein